MNRLLSFLSLLSLTFLCQPAHAGHIHGADMNYVSLGGGRYRIIANIYRDCRSIPLNSPSFGVYAGKSGGNGCGTANLFFTRTSIQDISIACPTGSKACSTQNQISGYGLEHHVYETTVDFTKSPLNSYVGNTSCCEVTFFAGQCCRNGGITTGSTGEDFYVTCTINICNLSRCQNSEAKGPVITSPPPLFVCCNNPFYYNYGFDDTSDMDSLSFNLVAGFKALPANPVTYTSPYSYKIPLTPKCVSPTSITCKPEPYIPIPRGFFFDTTNADLIFTPIYCTELTPLAVQATEWRLDTTGKYVWIGKIRRDMRIYVSDNCGYNNAPHLDSIYNYEVDAGKKIEIRINVEDKLQAPFQMKRDSVLLSWNQGIPAGSFQIISDTTPNKETALFTWQTKKTDARAFMYHFTFSANDNYCPNPRISSRAVNIRVKTQDSSWFTFKRANCNTLQLTAFTDKIQTGNTFSWTVSDSATNNTIFTGTGQSITTAQLPAGKLRITLHIYNKLYFYDDIDRYMLFEDVSPVFGIPSDTILCPLIDYKSEVSLSKSKGPLKYSWTVNGTTNAKDTFAYYTITRIRQNYTLEITVRDTNGCVVKDTQSLGVFQDTIVSWKPKTITVCHDTGNLLMNKYLNVGDSSNISIWSKTSSLIQQIAGSYYFLTKATDNEALQSGSSHLITNYATFTSSRGCITKDSMTIKINGNPIVELRDRTFCQDLGKFRTDSLIIRPVPRIGLTHSWKVTSAPTGVSQSGLLTIIGGTQWYLNVGNKNDTNYAGKYVMELRVVGTSTTCSGKDTGVVTVINEAKFNYLTEEICPNIAEYSLVTNCRLDGISVQPPPATTYNIRSFNYKTSDPKVSGTALKNGYLFPATAGAGHWTFDFSGKAYGCPVSDTFGIVVNPAPIAAFTTTPKDSTLVSQPTFTTANSSTISGGTMKYFWNFGTGNSADTSNAINPTIIYPAQKGSYDVTLIATSDKGCRDTFSHRLFVTTSVGLPKAVRPENTRLDNQFRVIGLNYKTMETRIFDVSGKQIAEFQNNIGELVSPGIYYYQIHVTFMDKEPVLWKGAIKIQE